jgi:MFS family permease
VAAGPPSRVWNRRRPINYPKQIEMAGGIAAPLLVGFSLTTVAQLVIGRDHPWLSEWAIALFAIAAALLVYTVQFSATALAYAATPAERLDYNPEAASAPGVLRIVRNRQWEEMELRARYARSAKHCYNLGLLAFLSGFGLLLVPHDNWPWPWGRLIGVVVVGISLIIEVIWTLSDGRRPRWLLPTSDPVVPDYLPDDGAEYLFSGEPAQIASDLRRCVELLEHMAARESRHRPGTGAPAQHDHHEPHEPH